MGRNKLEYLELNYFLLSFERDNSFKTVCVPDLGGGGWRK
jgi:hypothetical protein